MENKHYYVELAYKKDGLYYEVEPLTAKKMLEYCSDLFEIDPKFVDKINLTDEIEVQWLYNKIFHKPYVNNVAGKIYIVYAVSEEEALGKALVYNTKLD